MPVLGRASVADIGTGAGADPASAVVRRRVVEDALATLRPEARAALVLRHYYGYDYAQIGAFLGTASGTVGSILTRAHATLRGRLEGETPSRGQAPVDQTRSPRSHPSEPTTKPPEVLP